MAQIDPQTMYDAWCTLPRYKPAQVGNYKIETWDKAAGEEETVVSMREALMSRFQIKAVSTHLPAPATFARMTYNGGTWMSTIFQEVRQSMEDIAGAKGNVLVGGLGLGVAANLLARMKRVKSLTIIELKSQVIKLISPYLPSCCKVIHADLHQYLKACKAGRYDWAYFDIWQGTGEWVWQTEIVPLRRLAMGKIPQVVCWQEETMKGQLVGVAGWLYRQADMDAGKFRGSFSLAPKWVWREAVKHLRPVPRIPLDLQAPGAMEKTIEIENENRQDGRLQRLAEIFINPGTVEWECAFGKLWDRALTWEKEH